MQDTKLITVDCYEIRHKMLSPAGGDFEKGKVARRRKQMSFFNSLNLEQQSLFLPASGDTIFGDTISYLEWIEEVPRENSVWPTFSASTIYCHHIVSPDVATISCYENRDVSPAVYS